MTLQIQQYKTKTIIFKKSGNVHKRGNVISKSKQANIVVAPLSSIDEPPQICDYDMQQDFSPQEVDDFRADPKQTFFGFPDPLLWLNNIEGVRFQANSFRSSSQIHVMQDFDLLTENKTEIAQLKPNYVCIYLINLRYSNSSRNVVSICSSKECSSSSALNRYVY
jgi:hypothetical protein